jgi:hypothetical protein
MELKFKLDEIVFVPALKRQGKVVGVTTIKELKEPRYFLNVGVITDDVRAFGESEITKK